MRRGSCSQFPPHPALSAGSGGLLRGRGLRIGDGLGGGHGPRHVAARSRPPGLAPSSVLAYLAQAAEALTHLHSQTPPVIHGDVKPANLILTTGGRVKLVDFGISSAPNALRRRLGTPGYRAPELASDGAPSRASDVYALAATAFALLTGAPPIGRSAALGGHRPRSGTAARGRDPPGDGDEPGAATGHAGRAGLSGCARAGRRRCPSGVTHVLSVRNRGGERHVGLRAGRDGAGAGAARRADGRGCVERCGGRFLKSKGDPIPPSRRSSRRHSALDAALAATRALVDRDGGRKVFASPCGSVSTPVRRSAAGPTTSGRPVSLAARVRDQADGGQILLSSVTTRLDLRTCASGLGTRRPRSAPPARRRVYRSESTPSRAAGVILATSGERTVPYRGLLAFEPEDRGLLLRPRTRRRRADRPARGGKAAGRRGSLGERQIVGAQGRPHRCGARGRGARRSTRTHLLTPGHAHRLRASPIRSAVLLVVDQFEELFTLCPGRRSQAGVHRRAARRPRAGGDRRASRHVRQARRSPRTRPRGRRQPATARGYERRGARACRDRARTIGGAAARAGTGQLAVRDVAGQPGALPLLSHALRATWERRDGRTLTGAGYRETGGVPLAIARTADGLLASLSLEQRQMMRGMFLRLTEIGDGGVSRRRVELDELVPKGVPPKSFRPCSSAR